MFINKQQRIDIHSDTITSALLKKTNHEKLSKTTLYKLASIANSHFGLTKAEAKTIFIKNKPIEKSACSIRLAYELKKVISQVSNHTLKDKIGGFIRNSNPVTLINIRSSDSKNAISQMKCMSTAEFVDAYSNSIGRTIGEGSEALVVEDRNNNHKVFKIFFEDVSKNEIFNQASAFERFYGKNSAHIISGRAIHMDKIKGAPLSQIKEFPANATINFMSLIAEMVRKGCAPSDLSENNFLYDKVKNTFLPVDISPGKDNKVDENGIMYLKNYISNKTAY